MTKQSNRRRMPRVHLPLIIEIKAILEKEPDISEFQLKQRILKERNLPTNPNDPYWMETGSRSTRGKFRKRGVHFDDLFNHALNKVRGRI